MVTCRIFTVGVFMAPMNDVLGIKQLIQALGGVTKAAEFFGEEVNVVGNWQLRKKMPANKFLAHQAILLSHGISAPPELWFGSANVSKIGIIAREPIPTLTHGGQG